MKHNNIYILAAFMMLFCTAIPALYADEICDISLQEGKTAYNDGNYQKAKELFEYVKSECGRESKYSEIQYWIDQCNEALTPTTLSVSSTSLSFDANGGNKTITVTCNREWSLANTSSGMFTVTRNGNQLTISCNANNSTNSRSDYFGIKTKEGQKFQRISIFQQARISPRTFIVNGFSFTMVYVYGGTFMMGAADQDQEAFERERPAHSVTLNDYYIGETEVTQALWQTVMGSNPSFDKQGGMFPVENVSYEDCCKFIQKLNSLTGQHFRLPTEAEWEYAARGGNLSRGYKYAGSDDISTVAWYYANSGNRINMVKRKYPNELDLYDMSGNVMEWCNDKYCAYSSDSQINPKGSTSLYDHTIVYRGGDYGSGAKYSRVSYRSDGYSANIHRGLRLAL